MPASGTRIGITTGTTRTTMWGSARTTALSSNLYNEDSGATGIYYPALGELNLGPLFGRETEDQGYRKEDETIR